MDPAFDNGLIFCDKARGSLYHSLRKSIRPGHGQHVTIPVSVTRIKTTEWSAQAKGAALCAAIDRTAHVFWHHLDPGHPLHDPDRAARYAPEILATYQRMDAMVGNVVKNPKQAVAIAISEAAKKMGRYKGK